jgi:hypothetical protein
VSSQSEDIITGLEDFCLSDDEYELYIMINEYRSKFGQPSIPLSRSLSWVARIHAQDLIYNKPDKFPCTWYSWSEKGRWSPCCYKLKDPDYNCMFEKPFELTGYKSDGYELIYRENNNISVDQPFEMWTAYNSSRSMLICTDKWEDFEWYAIGVAVMDEYAILWFGQDPDQDGEPVICSQKSSEVVDEQVTTDSIVADPGISTIHKYHLIVASFNSLESANNALIQYKTEGFVNAKVIVTENKFQISLQEFENIDEARRIKKQFDESYPEVWILTE